MQSANRDQTGTRVDVATRSQGCCRRIDPKLSVNLSVETFDMFAAVTIDIACTPT